MKTEPDYSLFDRLAFAFICALTGLAYGLLLSIIVFFIGQHYYVSLIVWSTVVFALLGLFFENIVLEAIVALVGIVMEIFRRTISNHPDTFSSLSLKDSSKTHLWVLMVLIFGTKIVVSLLYF